MQCVILAGGLATRLRPLTQNTPKSLIMILGKPFLQYQIELLKSQNITEIVLCVGHFAEKIVNYFADGSKFGVKLTYSFETNQLLGTGGALKNAASHLQSDFFVMYGDSYLPINFITIENFFRAAKAKACMVVYKNNAKYDKSNVIYRDNLVIKYDKSNTTPDMHYIDYGLSILTKDILTMLPENSPADLADLFKKLAHKNELLGYETTERFYEIGSQTGLQDFTQYINKKTKTHP